MKEHIGFQIHRLAAMIDRSRVHSEIVAESERLTDMHGWLIHYLYDHQQEDVFQKDLERQFSIGRSTVTSILQTMERNGLILRKPVQKDARLKKIILTQRAVSLHLQIQENMERFEALLTQGISPEELSACADTLEKIRSNLLAANQKEDSV